MVMTTSLWVLEMHYEGIEGSVKGGERRRRRRRRRDDTAHISGSNKVNKQTDRVSEHE